MADSITGNRDTADLAIDPIPAFTDNYIWALHRGGHAVVVDPGDAAPVEAFLAAHALVLDAIVLTHHHGDHVGGVADLAATRPGLPVYGPGIEAIPGVNHALHDGERFTLAVAPDTPVRVLAVPGHTRGHLAYRIEDAIFCGDTLFAAGCGRLFEGTAAQMHASLQRLAALPAATRMFCAHEYTLANLRFALAVEPGNAVIRERIADAEARRARGQPTLPSTIGLERASNPFLRVREGAVIASAVEHARETQRGENFAPSAPSNDEAVFALLREWKNRFR